MYVSGLDRPWLETPFYLQGFMVRNTSEVQKLALYCDYVYIDYNKSIANFEVAVAHKIGHDRKLGVAETPFDKELATRRITKYSEQVAVTSEIKIATAEHDRHPRASRAGRAQAGGAMARFIQLRGGVGDEGRWWRGDRRLSAPVGQGFLLLRGHPR